VGIPGAGTPVGVNYPRSTLTPRGSARASAQAAGEELRKNSSRGEDLRVREARLEAPMMPISDAVF
jgi:hypothetical protein